MASPDVEAPDLALDEDMEIAALKEYLIDSEIWYWTVSSEFLDFYQSDIRQIDSVALPLSHPCGLECQYFPCQMRRHHSFTRLCAVQLLVDSRPPASLDF